MSNEALMLLKILDMSQKEGRRFPVEHAAASLGLKGRKLAEVMYEVNKENLRRYYEEHERRSDGKVFH